MRGLLLLALGACRSDCPPLDAVPIEGDFSDAERANARRLVGAFQTNLALPMCVAHIRAVESDRYGGRYNPVTDGVRVAVDDVPTSVVDQSLHHELCHALDRGNLLMEQDPELWGAGGARARKETFARWCEAVWPSAYPVLHPVECPDGEGLDPRDAFLRDAAYQARVADDVGWAEAVVVVAAPAGLDGLDGVGCLGDGSVRLWRGTTSWRLGPDGALEEEGLLAVDELVADGCRGEQAPEGFVCPRTGCTVATLPDGRSVGRYRLDERVGRGPVVHRWLVEGEDGVEALDRCPPSDGAAVVLGGEPVLLTLEGGDISLEALAVR